MRHSYLHYLSPLPLAGEVAVSAAGGGSFRQRNWSAKTKYTVVRSAEPGPLRA